MIFSRVFPTHKEERSKPGPTDDYWYGEYGQDTWSGKRINAESAMSIGAVFACLRVLSESISTLPCLMYERTADGRTRAGAHPLAELLRYQPNNWQTATEFWEMMVGHAALRGQAFAEIIPGPRGFADQLIPLHPDRVEVKYLKSGMPDFLYQEANGQKRPISFDLMFWIKGPFGGLSIVSAARESFGLALASEEHASRLFGQGIQVSGVLEHPGVLGDEAASRLSKDFNRNYGGVGNAHRAMVLEEGMKWTKIGLTAEDSQFIQSRKFQLNEIARWFRIPPHMIGDLERSTFSNIEHQSIEFVTHTLRPWLVRIEQAIRRDLILAKQRFFAEFLVDGLLRGDQKARYDAYTAGINGGFLTRNEVRGFENQNPLPGLDDPLMPLNMTPVVAGSQAPIEPPPTEPTPVEPTDTTRANKLLISAAERILRRQSKAIAKATKDYEGDVFEEWVRRYMDHQVPFVSEQLAIEKDEARNLCIASANEIVQSESIGDLLKDWDTKRVEQVVKYVEML